MLLRYTGHIPISFMALARELSPGDLFEVPDSVVPGYLSRADVEAVDPPKPVRRKASKDTPSEPTPAGQLPDPAVEEVPDGHVSSDH